MPELAVCLLVTTAVYVLLIPDSWHSNLTRNTGVAAFIGASNIVLARNTDAYFATMSEFNPFLHTWSLGVGPWTAINRSFSTGITSARMAIGCCDQRSIPPSAPGSAIKFAEAHHRPLAVSPNTKQETCSGSLTSNGSGDKAVIGV
jgi:hypothetical protein